jgi:LysM repeat protein
LKYFEFYFFNFITLDTFLYICQNMAKMFKRVFLFLSLITLTVLYSCKTYKPVASSTYSNLSTQDYIDSYKTIAISEMKRTGIPASITLAQAIVESDIGRSRLAKEANNHFGIKCHDDWTGPTVRHSDDRRNECFRKYSRPEGSYRDHSDFLKGESRYKPLFSLDIKDYKGWARGLKKAGYATNPDYANMLIRKIEEYNLSQYDNGLIASGNSENKINEIKEVPVPKEDRTAELKVGDLNGNFSVTGEPSRVREKNRIQYIIVKDGDTKENLEKDFQLLNWELARYNELQPGFKIVAGQILYLQPKRDRAETGSDFHFASDGETMYIISQIYGIKLRSLLTMNRMEAGQNPAPGQKIWLRSVKPVN